MTEAARLWSWTIQVVFCSILVSSPGLSKEPISDAKAVTIHEALCNKLNPANPAPALPAPAKKIVNKIGAPDLKLWFEAAQGSSLETKNPCLNVSSWDTTVVAVKNGVPVIHNGNHPIHGTVNGVVRVNSAIDRLDSLAW
jgi:hypothetical protein